VIGAWPAAQVAEQASVAQVKGGQRAARARPPESKEPALPRQLSLLSS